MWSPRETVQREEGPAANPEGVPAFDGWGEEDGADCAGAAREVEGRLA